MPDLEKLVVAARSVAAALRVEAPPADELELFGRDLEHTFEHALFGREAVRTKWDDDVEAARTR